MLLLEHPSHYCYWLEHQTTIMHIFWPTFSQFCIFLLRNLCKNSLGVPDGQRILWTAAEISSQYKIQGCSEAHLEPCQTFKMEHFASVLQK